MKKIVLFKKHLKTYSGEEGYLNYERFITGEIYFKNSPSFGDFRDDFQAKGYYFTVFCFTEYEGLKVGFKQRKRIGFPVNLLLEKADKFSIKKIITFSISQEYLNELLEKCLKQNNFKLSDDFVHNVKDTLWKLSKTKNSGQGGVVGHAT